MRRSAAAVAAGALLAAAFPPADLGPLAWVALAPVMILAVTASSVRRAAFEGLLFAASFHALTFAWWYGLLRIYGRLSHPEAAGVYLLLTLYIGIYGALFGAAIHRVGRRAGRVRALAVAPFAWAGLELIRGRALSGLPWSVLGATQHADPAAIQIAELAGVTGVSLVVASCSAALSLAALARRGSLPDPRAAWRAALALLLLPALAFAWGAVRLRAGWEGAGAIRVGLVQGNVSQDEKWEASERTRILEDHLEATREAAERGATLVVWPESSVPLAITSTPAYRMLLESRAASLGIDLLVGSVHYEIDGAEQRAYNSAILIPGRDPGASRRYDKMHLVPFGEYVPLSEWLGPVKKVVEEASDFSAGLEPAVFTVSGGRIGPFICFEAVFPELVRRVAVSGAQLLVNMTNDAMLGDSAGPRQHLALATLRAVETRRWMVRAANTGISAVIDPAGRVVQSAPIGVREVIVADVPLLDGTTLYARAGDAAGWGCVIVTLLALFFTSLPGRRPS